MCGRFSVSLPPDEIGRYFEVSGPLPNFPPHYNPAPTQLAPVVRFNLEARTWQLDLLRWGLIPSWAQDPKIGNQCINARVETMATKPASDPDLKRNMDQPTSNPEKEPRLFGGTIEPPIALWQTWTAHGEGAVLELRDRIDGMAESSSICAFSPGKERTGLRRSHGRSRAA